MVSNTISRVKTLDKDLQLKDAGAVSTSAAAQVGGSDQIIKIGGARSATVALNVTAIDVSDGDESYTFVVRLSNDPTFATGIVSGSQMRIGTDIANLLSVDSTTGLYLLPFTTEINGVIYDYVNLYHVLAGTTPSVDYEAYIVTSS